MATVGGGCDLRERRKLLGRPSGGEEKYYRWSQFSKYIFQSKKAKKIDAHVQRQVRYRSGKSGKWSVAVEKFGKFFRKRKKIFFLINSV